MNDLHKITLQSLGAAQTVTGSKHLLRTPELTLLVDDIISTAHTMIETVKHLRTAGMAEPVCIGVHPVFAGNAFDDLIAPGAAEVISCNTIQHPSNRIDVAEILATAISEYY